MVNIINHGQGDSGNANDLDITLTSGPDRLTIEAVYEGGPFDPVKDAPPPVLTGTLDDRPVGGLGLHLVRSLVDELCYRREHGKNHVVLAAAETGDLPSRRYIPAGDRSHPDPSRTKKRTDRRRKPAPERNRMNARTKDDEIAELREEVRRLRKILNTPLFEDFTQAAKLEAAHQVWSRESRPGRGEDPTGMARAD